jgi:hypothetical protein
MELSSIILARVFTFFQVNELDPRNRISPFDLTALLVEKYGFRVYPREIKDYDFDKGVDYMLGKFDDGTLIGRVTQFSNGLAVETGSSTDDSEKVLDGMLAWGAQALGLNYKPEMTRRRGYVSQVAFKTDVALDGLNPILRMLAERITKRVAEAEGVSVPFETTAVVINFDALNTKLPVGVFEIARRENVPFSDNTYFSQAPIPTEEHLQLLADLEAALKG